MFSEKYIRLGKPFGIPFGLDYTFLFIAMMALMMGWVGLYLVLFVSVAIHEFGHALVARRFGIECTRIVLHAFGGAAILLTNAETTLDAHRQAKEEFLFAIAGPLTSFALALLFGVTLLVVGTNFWLSFALGVNLIIGTLNLMPVFPLDGGRILRAGLTWRWGYRTATVATRWVSRMILAVAVAWILAGGHYFYFIITILVTLLGEQQAAIDILSHDLAAERRGRR